jgi:hypothetical protein
MLGLYNNLSTGGPNELDFVQIAINALIARSTYSENIAVTEQILYALDK